MTFQIHLRFKDNKLLLQAFRIQTDEVVFLEVILKCIVVDIVLLLSVTRSAIANVASFVAVAAVSIELVVSVVSLAAESTLGVSPETTLVNGSGNMVSVLLMVAQLCHRKELMLVGEDFLVPST